MKKELVVVKIEAAQNGEPYVSLMLRDRDMLRVDTESPGDRGKGSTPQNPSTYVGMDLKQYREMSLMVGDLVFVELTKAKETFRFDSLVPDPNQSSSSLADDYRV